MEAQRHEVETCRARGEAERQTKLEELKEHEEELQRHREQLQQQKLEDETALRKNCGRHRLRRFSSWIRNSRTVRRTSAVPNRPWCQSGSRSCARAGSWPWCKLMWCHCLARTSMESLGNQLPTSWQTSRRRSWTPLRVRRCGTWTGLQSQLRRHNKRHRWLKIRFHASLELAEQLQATRLVRTFRACTGCNFPRGLEKLENLASVTCNLFCHLLSAVCSAEMCRETTIRKDVLALIHRKRYNCG